MNAPKFTPGPWYLEELKLNRFTGEPFETGQIVGPDHNEIIADIPDYRYDPADAIRQTANARLIAAAPELYEALDQLRTVMACHDSTPEEFLALSNAVNALAKAVTP